MKTKLSMTLALFVICIACGSQAQNSKVFKLPSGKEIKIPAMNVPKFRAGKEFKNTVK